MTEFQDKNIVIVGGTSGIGASIVKQLTDSGAKVFNIARRASQAPNVTNIKLDITSDFQSIDGLPDQIDGLIYCPGTINLKPFQSLKPEDFLKDFEVNVLGAVKTIKATMKNMKAAGQSSIVLFSTVAVERGMNFHASIASSKGAIEGLTKSLAAEFSKSNIRVNAIAPSVTDTPLASGILGSEERRKLSQDRHPIKAIGQPEDVAAMSLFLLSNNAKWMTGQVMLMDGGMSSIISL